MIVSLDVEKVRNHLGGHLLHLAFGVVEWREPGGEVA